MKPSKRLVPDDNSPVHLHLSNGSGENTSTDRDLDEKIGNLHIDYSVCLTNFTIKLMEKSFYGEIKCPERF